MGESVTRRSRPKASYLTVTDQFCGAGGSSIGAAAAGLEISMAMNHWDLAVETHNTNFPNADHDCADISAADPRRYPSTDILITSPECTTHSPAGGNRHKKSQQRDLFVSTEDDPETVRSRATMWDVVRFAEYHQYRAIIVENVVEVFRTWVLFPTWWQAMESLGYHGQMVSLNSMFALFDGMTTPPAPQSRDRLYVVWTRDRRRKPDLRIEPWAPCPTCGIVESRQTWRQDRRAGKYGLKQQYWYTCPSCRQVVEPFFFCALNAIDFSIPAKRIGDRPKPLKPRTLERVRYGWERYGRRPLQVVVRHGSGVACRVRGVDEPLFSQTTERGQALVFPWLVNAGSNDFSTRSTAESPAPVVTCSERVGVAMRHPFLVVNRSHNKGVALDAAMPPLCTGGHHMLIQPAALVRLLGEMPVRALDSAIPTQTCGADQNLLISPAPYVIQYYGSTQAAGSNEAIPTQSTKDRHALIASADDRTAIEDLFFRILKVPEVQATMAFHRGYVIKGTAGKQIKQLGNAVTPPAMELLIQRVVQFLAGTRWEPRRVA